MINQGAIPRYTNPGLTLVTTELWRADRYGRRLELLNRGTLGATIEHNDDASGVKRTMTVETFRAIVGLTPFVDCLIPVMRMTEPNGESIEQQLGHFTVMPSDTRETKIATSGPIACQDISYFLSRSTFRDGYLVPGSIDRGEAVRTIILDAGFRPHQLQIPDTGKLTPIDGVYFTPGTKRLDAANELLNGGAWYTIHVNNAGRFTTADQTPLRERGVTSRYTGADDGTTPVLPALQLRPDVSRLRNVVTVINVRQDQPPIYWTAVNDNPASPVNVDGPLGEMAETVPNSQIETQADARTIAENLLQIGESYYERMELPTGPDLRVDAHDIVEIDLQRSGRPAITGRWWRQGWRLPLESTAPILTQTLNRVEPYGGAAWD